LKNKNYILRRQFVKTGQKTTPQMQTQGYENKKDCSKEMFCNRPSSRSKKQHLSGYSENTILPNLIDLTPLLTIFAVIRSSSPPRYMYFSLCYLNRTNQSLPIVATKKAYIPTAVKNQLSYLRDYLLR